MIKSVRSAIGFAAIMIMLCASEAIAQDKLEKGLVNVPDSIQTSVYWYWISDHISNY
jgi:hypothetical protein